MSFLDLSKVKESNFDILPEGQYNVVADEATVKETKSGKGEYINLKLIITGGPLEGRTLFHMFNFKNENVKAAEIGMSQLKTFLKCAGQDPNKLQNVSDLIGCRVSCVVKHKEDDYGKKAVISYFKPVTTIAENEVIKEDLPF